MRTPATSRPCRAPSAALLALACLYAAAACLPAPASAQGVGRLLRPITGSIADQRRVIEASRVSLRVVRPKLAIVRDKEAGGVSGLSLSRDGRLLFAVLADGSARLWDLERGVQLGGVIARGLLTGNVVARGRQSEVVAVERGGSVVVIRPDGAVRRVGRAAEFPRGTAVVLSAAGTALAYRSADGWRLVWSGRTYALTGAAPAFPPVLSPDGRRVVYVTARGAVMAADVSSGDSAALAGCARNAALTAGAFLPDGSRVMLGDRRGNLCLWQLPARGQETARLLGRKRVHRGAVGAIAVSGDGRFVATRDGSGSARVWSAQMPVRRVAEVELGAGAAGALALDARRRWLFAAEASGTVGIYAYAGRQAGRLAGLISTNDGGWAVLNREGRFDGPQSGVDALLWAADTAAQTLPVDAFSESYFEPGLLAKLDEPSPRFLNAQMRDLSEDGYIAPPAVTIEPIDTPAADAQGRSRVRVRLQNAGYPRDAVLDVRLYHNGKLVNQPAVTGQAFEYAVRLLPGANTFRAVGVGPGGIEGPPATATVTLPAPTPRRPRMQVVAVGIDKYHDPLDELLFARNDAQAVVSALRERGSRPFHAVAATVLLDSLASAPAIEETIARGLRAGRSARAETLCPKTCWWSILPATAMQSKKPAAGSGTCYRTPRRGTRRRPPTG